MVSEAVRVLKQEEAIDFTVANGTGIEKGTLLKMTSPRTAIINSAAGDMCAGIAAREKIASDGRTRLAVYRKGIFRMYSTNIIPLGEHVMASNIPNLIARATGTISGASIVGVALETFSAGGSGEVAVNIGAGGSAE